MVDDATRYAEDVVSGRVVAGRLVTLACARHLRDLETGPARGLKWRPELAEAAYEFWKLCPHLKGRKWSGTTIHLEPWQKFVVGSAYGWQRADGHRRFKVIWCEVARKNGKSTFVYPAGLHALVCDGEPGAEVYSVATKRDQAKIIFDLCRQAVNKVRDLRDIIEPYRFSLVAEESFSKMEALSADADTLDGLSPSCVLADEIHKWKGRALWDVIETGMGARQQPLLWATTTAGDEGEQDVYGQEHTYCRQVLEGTIEDDTRFAYIATLDPGDDWTDPTTWVKANPNIGVSVRAEEIGEAIEKAKNSPAAANAVKRLRLNVRTQDADAWLPLQVWDAGKDDRVTREALRGFPCSAGLDLASSSDFAALALLFPLTSDWKPAPDPTRPDFWAVLFELWLPASGISFAEKKLRETAAPWIRDGWVTTTPGDTIDHGVIEEGILRAAREFDLIGVAYDPFNAGMLATRLQAEGIDVKKFTQNMGSFAAPTQLFEAAVLEKRLRHDGNPAVRWMVDNCVLVSNAAGHRMPSRKKSRAKIDGVVAAVMAVGRAADDAATGRPGYYDSNGVGVL